MPPSRGIGRSDQSRISTPRRRGSSALPLRRGRDQSGDCATRRPYHHRNAAALSQCCGQKTSASVCVRSCSACSRAGLLEPADSEPTPNWSDSRNQTPSRMCFAHQLNLVIRPVQAVASRVGRDDKLRWKDDGIGFGAGLRILHAGVDRSSELYGFKRLWSGWAGGSSRNRNWLGPFCRVQQRLAPGFRRLAAASLVALGGPNSGSAAPRPRI